MADLGPERWFCCQCARGPMIIGDPACGSCNHQICSHCNIGKLLYTSFLQMEDEDDSLLFRPSSRPSSNLYPSSTHLPQDKPSSSSNASGNILPPTAMGNATSKDSDFHGNLLKLPSQKTLFTSRSLPAIVDYVYPSTSDRVSSRVGISSAYNVLTQDRTPSPHNSLQSPDNHIDKDVSIITQGVDELALGTQVNSVIKVSSPKCSLTP